MIFIVSYSGHSQPGNVPGYGSNVPELDLVYYPDPRTQQVSRSRPRHSGSAPFSDTGFNPISSNNPGNVFSARQPNQTQPISYGTEVSGQICCLKLNTNTGILIPQTQSLTSITLFIRSAQNT